MRGGILKFFLYSQMQTLTAFLDGFPLPHYQSSIFASLSVTKLYEVFTHRSWKLHHMQSSIKQHEQISNNMP
jgi:hypothetical protein